MIYHLLINNGTPDRWCTGGTSTPLPEEIPWLGLFFHASRGKGDAVSLGSSNYHLLWSYRGQGLIIFITGSTGTYTVLTSAGIFHLEDCEPEYLALYMGSFALSIFIII